MNGVEPGLAALLGFLAGGVLAALVVLLLSRRRLDRAQILAAEELSAARAMARSERERREELEREDDELRGTIRELDRQVAVAAERHEQAERMLAEQRSFVESARKELEGTFEKLAGAALKGSSEQFLSLADQKLAAARAEAAADLEQRRRGIQTMLEPLQEALGKLDSRTQEIEVSRVEAYGRIDQQIQMLARATQKLESKTGTLVSALSGSQARGRWGELALRNVAELAGMTAHCDFEEQLTIGEGKRPDMTVRLPGGRSIAVDAKAPLSAFLDASSATDESARQEALGRHVRDLRAHIRKLSARDYAETLGGRVDLVVMFLPGDPFLSAAFAKDPELQVEALRSKVLIATPTTLVALLRTVAIYWQQQALADNAEAIAATARELYERAAKFGEELSSVGRGLKTALDAYNRAVGSFEARLMPMGRRLEEMKVSEHTRRSIEAPRGVDEVTREPVR